MIARAAVAGLVLLLCACQQGSSGRLLAEPDTGVELSRKSVKGDVAVVTAGSLRISAFGFWTSRQEQSLYVTYVNSSAAALRIKPGDFTLRIGNAPAELVQVLDYTGKDIAQLDLPPDDPRRLVDLDTGRTSAELVIPAGAERQLSVGFARLPEGRGPGAGAIVEAGIPTGEFLKTIRFRASGGDLRRSGALRPSPL